MKQGDIIKIDFSSTIGHKQSGYRPAVVVSGDNFNNRSSMIFVCPITNANRQYPMHLFLGNQTTTTGYVMCDQLKAVDCSKRPFVFVEEIPKDLLKKILMYVGAIMEINKNE